MIEAIGLRKRYGDHVAVDDVSLEVPEGKVLGVLGPNGAGKSTTVRMLTTMTRPDGGTGRIAGLDVVSQARSVRRTIGVTGQDATLDELLTGVQNLVLVGELAKMRRAEAQHRANELLEHFELTEAAGRAVKTYSGGMRRRLDLAASLVARPPVLFLDEPTTGLDPASRQRMWQIITDLVADGTTVLLTTQYLDEADELADAITVIDHGRVIAHGTSSELKARVGGEQLTITLADAQAVAAEAVAHLAACPVRVEADGRVLVVPVVPRSGLTTDAVRALDTAGVVVDHLELHRPSLDDVFFVLTGAGTETGTGTGPGDERGSNVRAGVPESARELQEVSA
jgi:daunorubicin resistance ABC transporter ATP-binding subunit